MPLPLALGASALARVAAVNAVRGLALEIRFIGLDAWQRRMRNAKGKLRKEMKRKMREAANIVKVQARKEITATFTGDARSVKRLRRKTSVSVRSKRGRVSAQVGPKGFAGVYGRVHELGMTIERKSRSGKVHEATYPVRKFIEPAVRKTDGQVRKILGQSFKVV